MTESHEWRTRHCISVLATVLLAAGVCARGHAMEDGSSAISAAQKWQANVADASPHELHLQLTLALLDREMPLRHADNDMASARKTVHSEYSSPREMMSGGGADPITLLAARSLHVLPRANETTVSRVISATPAPAVEHTGQRAVQPTTKATLVASTWSIAPSDHTLHAALARWAAAAGWQLVWDLAVDYPVQAHASISGTFEEAIAVVAGSLNRAEVPVTAIFYSGNRVLRIVAKGDE